MKAFIVSIGLVVLSVSVSAGLVTVDPDNVSGVTTGKDISNEFPYVTLSSGGGAPGLDGKVYAVFRSGSSGNMVFANKKSTSTSKSWFNSDTNGYYFRADFTNPTNYVSIDVISSSSKSYPCLWYGKKTGDVVELIKLNPDLRPTSSGQVRKVILDHTATAPDIAFIRIGGSELSSDYTVYLDNLQFEIPEPASCVILLSGLLLVKTRRK